MKQKRMRSVLALGVAAVLFTGCGTHNPTTDVNLRKERSASFQDLMVKDAAIEPVQTSMTLSMAIARAVKYNLDHRVKMMETAVAQEQLSLARMSYLPEVTAMAGYSSRNNEPGAISRSLATGDVSLEYSTSQEKDHTITSLRGAWDVIDFGLTYYSVSQKTDEILIAQEQRRKVVQNIIQDVQEAYWRAYIAQELLGQVNAIATESDQALVRFKSLANTGKVDPKQSVGLEVGKKRMPEPAGQLLMKINHGILVYRFCKSVLRRHENEQRDILSSFLPSGHPSSGPMLAGYATVSGSRPCRPDSIRRGPTAPRATGTGETP